MKRNITPENITKLDKDSIFVFGSNEGGKHGAGAALTAKEKFGAVEGVGFGPQGQSFAIPTKNWNLSSTLSKDTIECYCVRFCEYALQHKDKKFYVTKIGCGLAGLTPEDVANCFTMVDMEQIDNIYLPEEFWKVLDKEYREEMFQYLKIEDDGAKNGLPDIP